MTGRAFYSDEPNRVIDNEDILRLCRNSRGKVGRFGYHLFNLSTRVYCLWIYLGVRFSWLIPEV